MEWISADVIRERVSMLDAVRAIQAALRAGLDPASDPARVAVPLTRGEFLLMPSESSGHAGVKVLTIAHGNPDRGLERIQGVYLLTDADTLTPLALLDGASLTTLRTPAVSAAAADLLAPASVDHLVVFGSGPQATAHIDALRAIRAVGRVTLIGRDPQKAADAAARSGADVGTPDAVASADVVVCATTAREPLFDGGLVRDDACVIAVGSHEPDARELDSTLVTRAQVVVEDRATALREAGDVVIPVREGVLHPATLIPLREIVTGEASVDHSRPRVFVSTGMSWEDLVIASAIYAAAPGTPA